MLPDAGLLARGLAGLRIFFGLILFAIGVAKLFEFRTIEIGPWKTFLINKEGARNVLEFETNNRGGDGTDVPLLKSIVKRCCRTGTSSSGWSRPSSWAPGSR